MGVRHAPPEVRTRYTELLFNTPRGIVVDLRRKQAKIAGHQIELRPVHVDRNHSMKNGVMHTSRFAGVVPHQPLCALWRNIYLCRGGAKSSSSQRNTSQREKSSESHELYLTVFKY